MEHLMARSSVNKESLTDSPTSQASNNYQEVSLLAKNFPVEPHPPSDEIVITEANPAFVRAPWVAPLPAPVVTYDNPQQITIN